MRIVWRDFVHRLELRFIRLLDVVNILVFDGVILGCGYAIIRLAEGMQRTGNRFFDAARSVSAGVFLLLYLVWTARSYCKTLRKTIMKQAI